MVSKYTVILQNISTVPYFQQCAYMQGQWHCWLLTVGQCVIWSLYRYLTKLASEGSDYFIASSNLLSKLQARHLHKSIFLMRRLEFHFSMCSVSELLMSSSGKGVYTWSCLYNFNNSWYLWFKMHSCITIKHFLIFCNQRKLCCLLILQELTFCDAVRVKWVSSICNSMYLNTCHRLEMLYVAAIINY